MLAAVTEAGRAMGATAQVGAVPDGRPDAMAFALSCGFVVERRMSKSVVAARDALYHHFTGVDPACRGRGIATALRRATIEYAIGTGAATLETHNDSANAAMLAINRAFGYRPEPGVTDLYRPLPHP